MCLYGSSIAADAIQRRRPIECLLVEGFNWRTRPIAVCQADERAAREPSLGVTRPADFPAAWEFETGFHVQLALATQGNQRTLPVLDSNA
jgi:hypothetical protein